MNKKALFVGNGINNVEQDYTWRDLISDLLVFIGAAGQIHVESKPFPLLYEEIFVEALKNRNIEEKNIKCFISNKISKLEPNKLHRDILSLGIQNILTTNYDLTFEKSLTSKPKGLINNGVVKETTYSIFRHYNVKKKNIWHIHGDANSHNSITLGYEHYSGYLQQMRNYIISGTGTSYKIKLDSLFKRIQEGNLEYNQSWLDFFVTHDIYILGLTLDFVEIHLWWLLTIRQRAKLTRELSVENKIVYFYPSNIANDIRNKLSLLRSSDVLAVSIEYDETRKIDFYHRIIDYINK